MALVPHGQHFQSHGKVNRAVQTEPAGWADNLRAAAPAEVRRTARARYKELVTQLLLDAQRSKQLTGKVEFPRSIEQEILTLAAAEGDPHLLDRIKQGSVRAIERYAAWQMEQAARAQKAQDQHKSTLDWHGHYNT